MNRIFSIMLGIATTAALLLAAIAFARTRQPEAKLAFVNSQRIITGFKPAYEVEKQLQKEEDDFKSRLKIKEDSLKAYIDSMSAKYNVADAKTKRAMQDELAARNQEINNVSMGHLRRMDKMRTEKMQSVYGMINAYLVEFGRKHEYSIIFGTVQGGNILYGEGTSSDITQQILDGLNERYK